MIEPHQQIILGFILLMAIPFGYAFKVENV